MHLDGELLYEVLARLRWSVGNAGLDNRLELLHHLRLLQVLEDRGLPPHAGNPGRGGALASRRLQRGPDRGAGVFRSVVRNHSEGLEKQRLEDRLHVLARLRALVRELTRRRRDAL